MTWLSLVAWAGPLDQPDPDEMSGYQCVQGSPGAPTLKDRTRGQAPPGPPVLPPELGSQLAPFASDEAQRRAAKGKLEAWPAVATLATDGVTLSADCEGPPTDRDDFSFGCTKPLQCELMTSIGGKAQRLATRPQAGQRLAPVESAREALGLIGIIEQDLFLPLTPGELAAWSAESATYVATEPAIPWAEVEEHEEGWLVRAPRRARCGCEHDLVRYSWWVSRLGRTCMVEETPVILAFGQTTCE
jgi:hypothetical protein